MPVHSISPEAAPNSESCAPEPTAKVFVEAIAAAKELIKIWASDNAASNNIARSVSYNMLAAYWDAIQEEEPERWTVPAASFPIDKSLDATLSGFSRHIGRLAANFDPIEAAFRLTSAYASLLPPEYRALNGIYYTPPPLTHRLLATAEKSGIDWSTAHVLDPACGGGAFLMPVAMRIIGALKNESAEEVMRAVEKRLLGFERDPFGAWSTQVFVEAALLPYCKEAGRRLKPVVIECDSLLQFSNPRKFDLVIGNPPYGRVTLRDGVREKYRRSLFGHANLYAVFTDLSLRLTKPDGLIALVTPTSFLAGEYYKALRHVLTIRTTPANFDFVKSRKGVFENVLQETVLATYKNASKVGQACTVHLVESEAESMKVHRIGRLVLPKRGGEPWIMPRRPAQAPLVLAMARHEYRLRDYGYEVVTGQLVWNRHKHQLRSGYKTGCFPLIWAEAVGPGGTFEFKAEQRNHEPFFEPALGQSWLITESPCILLQRTTAMEQSRRLVAAVLPAEFLTRWGGVVVENHLNIIRPISRDPAASLELLAALLNCEIADEAFRCINGSVAVSAYELNALPLPDPSRLPAVDLREEKFFDRMVRDVYLSKSTVSNGTSRINRRECDSTTVS